MKRIIEFAVKASRNFTRTDFRDLATFEGTKSLLKGYGYPSETIESTLTEDNYTEIADAIFVESI